ncbi:MAG: DUF4290 domain-containing protein [Bacteroidales bacterium]|jgi:hypothetical protein|nr:DUF4290 domain-containing protein [Bacteroidales bacterium]
MDYNTSRKKLVLPEYGRNIQNMVDYVVSVEDRDERNRLAQAVIAIMGNMNPHLRDVSDFKHKLWDHLAIMSEFSLDIDYPYELPDPADFDRKPDKVPYQKKNRRYRHYGIGIQKMIAAVSDIDDPERRINLITVIANHMKKSYLMWNKDAVTDEMIFGDLEHISDGQIVVEPGTLVLHDIKDHSHRPKNRQKKSRYKK